MLLPPVLHPGDLPVTELAAARLDGELFPLGDGFCLLDQPEGPGLRAHSVLGALPARLIAELGTAAWIWGSQPLPPPRPELCADYVSRARPAVRLALGLREMRFDPGDVVELDGVRVTSPLRTAVDLARFRDPFERRDADAVVALAGLAGFGFEDCVALMNRRRNLLGKRRAQARLAGLLN